jgi:hypothetical protein
MDAIKKYIHRFTVSCKLGDKVLRTLELNHEFGDGSVAGLVAKYGESTVFASFVAHYVVPMATEIRKRMNEKTTLGDWRYSDADIQSFCDDLILDVSLRGAAVRRTKVSDRDRLENQLRLNGWTTEAIMRKLHEYDTLMAAMHEAPPQQ